MFRWKSHDDVIKRKHFPRYWPFVRRIHRSPVNSQHKGQWRGSLMFSLICVWINGWMNNREAGDFRRYRAHYDVIVMNDKSVIQGPLNEQSVMLTKRGIWVTRPGYGYALLFTHDTNCHWVGFFNSAQTPCNWGVCIDIIILIST